MAYRMCFFGSIAIPNGDNPRAEKIEELMKRAEIVCVYSDEIQIHPFGQCLIVDVNAQDWKDRNNEMERFCLYVAQEYPHADGEIDVVGDEVDDRWKMEIKEGRVDLITFKLVEDTRRPLIWSQ